MNMRPHLTFFLSLLSVACLSCSGAGSTKKPIDQEKEPEKEQEVTPDNKDETSMTLNITANGTTISATFADNSSATAFAEKLKSGPVTVTMQDYGNMEKVGPLGFTLPRNDASIATGPGDIILYQGINIVIYYDVNSWSLTRLGKVNDLTQAQLKAFLGTGSVTVTFSL